MLSYSYAGRHFQIAVVDSARNWAGALLGVGVISVDISIVNVAIPTLARELHAGFSVLQWVLDAYIVAFAALLLATSVLARVYGPLALLRVGIAAFALASLVCGAAPNATVLIAARAAQGISASLIMPAALAITVRPTSGRSVASSLAVFSAVSGAATALGPSIGAVLLDHFGWRAVFFVNLPLAAIALLLLASTGRSESTTLVRPPNILIATVPSAAALVAVTFGLIALGRDGWHAGNIAVIAVGVGLFGVVAAGQRRGGGALALPGLAELRKGRVLVGSVATLIMFAVVMGATFIAPLVMIGLYGYSLMHMAAVLSLTSLAMVMVAPAAGLALSRVSAGLVATVGFGVAGTALLGFSDLGTDPSELAVAVASVSFGVGVGIALPALSMHVIGATTDNETLLDRVALFTTFRQVGLALGIAAFGTVAQHRIDLHIAQSGLHAHFSALGFGAGGGGASAACHTDANALPSCLVLSASWDGYADTFRVAAYVCAIAGLIVLIGGAALNRTAHNRTAVTRTAARRKIMSESTVELVRAGYETFRTQHAAGVLNLFDQNIEWLGWSGNTQLPGGGLFRGIPALISEVFGKMGQTWTHFEFRPERIMDAGDEVIVSGRLCGALRASNEDIDVPFVHIWTIKDGKARRVELFTDTLAVHQGLSGASV